MGSAAPPSKLFEPLRVGLNELSSRIIMAPLTRFRADDDHTPLPIVEEYYSQRASYPGTLIISEATIISPKAGGYPNVPEIYTDKQIAAWKKVVDAVHARGSFIWLQLWALGRVASPDAKKAEGTGDVVSSSNIPAQEGGHVPRELSEDEIQEYIAAYATAARKAVHEAGFDGVEIHGANGYLVDQFTQDKANQRTDRWGGSVENRSRFGIEVSKAVVAAVGAERTAIRLSPWSTFQGMKMADPVPQFSHLITHLKELKLAYLHLVESRIAGNADVEATEKNDPFIKIWGNTSPIFIAGGFKAESAKTCVDEEYKNEDVAVVFGRYFIPNPDLVFRLKNGIPLTQYDRNTFYNPKSPKGYIDWPFSEEWTAAHPSKQ